MLKYKIPQIVTLTPQHNRQQTISPCLNFILIFDFGALLSEEFKVRYATACHMEEEVRGGVQITKRGKVTSNISDIQEKWGKIIYPILVVIFFALLFYIMD